MDRRNFIKTAGMAAGAGLLSGLGLAEAAGSANKKADKMNIVVLTGSPRRKGNTNHLASQFIKGAEEAGHEIYRFDCAHSRVSPCMACNHCGMDGDCVFQDDFEELRPHLLAAHLVAFATPMYYFGFSSQLKTVIDRFYALNGRLKGAPKQAVLLMAYADTAPREAEPLLTHYHTLLHYLGWKDAGTVIAPGMWPAGAIHGTEYSRKAYALGRGLAPL